MYKLTGRFAFEYCDSCGGMDPCKIYEKVSQSSIIVKSSNYPQYFTFNPCYGNSCGEVLFVKVFLTNVTKKVLSKKFVIMSFLHKLASL